MHITLRRTTITVTKGLIALSLLALYTGCREAPHHSVMTRPARGGKVIQITDAVAAYAPHTVYVPVYSSILTSNSPQQFNLAITLSVRNTDDRMPVVVKGVRYFNHDGVLVQQLLSQPLEIAPMAAVEFFIREQDVSGGISASFKVDWVAENGIKTPLVEAVMIGASGGQGISFTTTGREL